MNASLRPTSLSLAVVVSACLSSAPLWGQTRAAVDSLGGSSFGSAGHPVLAYDGSPIIGQPFALRMHGARPNTFGAIGVSATASAVPLPDFGAVSHLGLPLHSLAIVPVDAHGVSGTHLAVASVAPAYAGIQLYAQGVVIDPAALGEFAFTSALDVTIGTGPSDPRRQFAAPNAHLGSGGVAIAAGDLDGDGLVDLVMNTGGTWMVEVAMNMGNRSFEFGAPFTLVHAPTDVELVDLDGDGVLDIVCVNSGGGNVSIGRGVGDGTFTHHFIAAVGILPHSVVVADFDLDGHLDLAVNNRGSNSVSILFNNGDATFAPAVPRPVGVDPIDIGVGDFNGDGLPDLVTVNAGGTALSVILQLSPFPGIFLGATSSPINLTCADCLGVVDFNGDGILDVIVSCHSLSSSGQTAYRGNGNGTFSHTTSKFGLGSSSRYVVHDVDGDGNLDLAIADWVRGVVSVNVRNAQGSIPAQSGRDWIGLAWHLEDFVIVDLDGDGIDDVAGVGNFLPVNFATAWGQGGGEFEVARQIERVVEDGHFAIGDFNADGRPDVAVHRGGYRDSNVDRTRGWRR